MLYVHCGWPRTSTSSLQAALDKHRHALAVAGFVYPDGWRAETVPGAENAHRGILGLLQAPPAERQMGLARFQDYLRSHADKVVVLSLEALSGWLTDERLEALLAFLMAAREVMPVACIWTLRRFDAMCVSLYLLQTRLGVEVAAPGEYFRDLPIAGMFTGMQRVEDAVGREVTYVKYDPGGSHNVEILRALGIPSSIRADVESDLAASPRLNASIGRKQAAALRFRDAIASRTGVAMTAASLRDAFYDDGFRFDGDRPYEVVDDTVKRRLCREAIVAARRGEFSPYLEFYEGDSHVEPCSPTPIALDALDDADLMRLADHLRGTERG